MRLLRVSTLVLTGLSLVPAGAHLFELPREMRLGQAEYFIVQSIYAGWFLFGIPLLLALLGNLPMWALERRSDRAEANWSLAAALMIAAARR